MPRCLAALLLLICIPQTAFAESNRPNFIIIYTDDQQRDAFGAYGNHRIHTPNLDAFASQGLRFTEAHTVLSLCSPARAALLTGRYGSANGVDTLNGRLNDGEQSFADHLKAEGYDTAVCGKWHLPNSPDSMGFDFACTFNSNGRYYKRRVNDNGEQKMPAEHIDVFCGRRSADYLREASKSENPFVLFHNTQTPHMDHRLEWNATADALLRYKAGDMPLPPTWDDDLSQKPPYLKSVRNRTVAQERFGYNDPEKIKQHTKAYYAVITDMDNALSSLLNAIDELKLRDNTYIVFMSDNGWMLGDHGMTSKVLCYQASTRVPLVITGPGIEPGVTNKIALNIDIAPTLLDLAGIQPPQETHGRSLKPILNAKQDARAVLPWRDHFIYECIGGYGGSKPTVAAIGHDWKMIYTFAAKDCKRKSHGEFYNLSDDPHEMNNLLIFMDGRPPNPKAVDEKGVELDKLIWQHVADHVRRRTP